MQIEALIEQMQSLSASVCIQIGSDKPSVEAGQGSDQDKGWLLSCSLWASGMIEVG